MIEHKRLYDAITEFFQKYKYRKFNDEENMTEYMKLVEMCVECGIIPKCNITEYSTHGRLTAAIAYEDNRRALCRSEKEL